MFHVSVILACSKRKIVTEIVHMHRIPSGWSSANGIFPITVYFSAYHFRTCVALGAVYSNSHIFNDICQIYYEIKSRILFSKLQKNMKCKTHITNTEIFNSKLTYLEVYEDNLSNGRYYSLVNPLFH